MRCLYRLGLEFLPHRRTASNDCADCIRSRRIGLSNHEPVPHERGKAMPIRVIACTTFGGGGSRPLRACADWPQARFEGAGVVEFHRLLGQDGANVMRGTLDLVLSSFMRPSSVEGLQAFCANLRLCAYVICASSLARVALKFTELTEFAFDFQDLCGVCSARYPRCSPPTDLVLRGRKTLSRWVFAARFVCSRNSLGTGIACARDAGDRQHPRTRIGSIKCC